MNDDFPPLLSGNDFRFDRVRQALLIAEAVLRGDRDAESERLVFRVLLSDFGVGSDVLTDTQKESLDSLVALAKRFPKTLNVVDIVGRASQTGSEANNVDLSVRRAVAASTYVITSGIAARRLAEPRGIGSANPILNVGPVEEPLNRSADVVFAFDVVPRFETLDPTLRWSVVLGAEVGWLIAGTQKITLIRDDTGERRTGTFNYVDVSISVVPDELMRAIFKKGGGPSDLFEEGLKALDSRWKRWLAESVFEAATSLSVIPTSGPGQPRPLAVGRDVGWEVFEDVPVFLIEPLSLATPVGEASETLLLFGWPYTIGACHGPDVSAGFASFIPDVTTGVKLGIFSFD